MEEHTQTNRSLTNAQARQFLLWKQGLLGEYRFAGKDGVLAFIRQAGCIQYDPIDVCGKNAELVLQSRVKGFRKFMLYQLLYEDRRLVDYFDKNLAIFPVEDYPYFERERAAHRSRERSYEEISAVKEELIRKIQETGPLCSSDLTLDRKVDWYWSSTKLSRAALEHLYFSGVLAIHHKKGTLKYYDLASNCIPARILSAPDPCPDELEHLKWRVRRRVGSVGLMWNRASDAWLNIPGLKSESRALAFAELEKEGVITRWQVEGLKDPLFSLSEDAPSIEAIIREPLRKKRCEFIAPLDNLLWDRKLIQALFGFDYKWEIYTPEAERKYGYYVLPILYGDRFVGRVEVLNGRREQALKLKNLWMEEGVRPTKTFLEALDRCLRRFARFHQASAPPSLCQSASGTETASCDMPL